MSASPAFALQDPSITASDARQVTLPGGLLDARGVRHRIVRLRELTGADEEVLCGQFASGAQQVTALLTRAIEAIDGWEGVVDEVLVERMLAGDRDFLLLRLRQREVGDHVHEVMRCRARECGKKVDVEFAISELPVRQPESLSDLHVISLDDGQGRRHLARLRLPNGADLAAIAPLLDGNPGAANTRLFARLLQSIEGFDLGGEEEVRALPLRLRSQLADFIRQHAPGPDLHIDVSCPHCGADMAYTFDLRGFFLPSGR